MALHPDDCTEMEGGGWVELVDGIDCFGREIRHWYWEIDEEIKVGKNKGKDKDDVEVGKNKGKDKDDDKDTDDDKGGEGSGESATRKPKIEGS